MRIGSQYLFLLSPLQFLQGSVVHWKGHGNELSLTRSFVLYQLYFSGQVTLLLWGTCFFICRAEILPTSTIPVKIIDYVYLKWFFKPPNYLLSPQLSPLPTIVCHRYDLAVLYHNSWIQSRVIFTKDFDPVTLQLNTQKQSPLVFGITC